MTYRNSVVAVVVPAYNESGFVGDVIEGVPTYVDRVYVVEDCSTDETWSEITAAASRVNDRRDPTDPYEQVVVPIQHDRNQGAGAAVLTGYRRALDDDVDVVATMDGDGQMDPAFLPALLDPIVDGEVAYTKGDRLDDLDAVGDMSRWRLFGNAVLTGLTRVSSGYWRLRDPQNGFTAISTEALSSLDLSALYDRYGFRNDVLVHLSVAGYRIADVSHPALYGEESSDIHYTSFIPRLSWLLLRRFWWRLGKHARRQRGGSALGMFLVGSLSLCLSLFLPFGDDTMTERPERRADGPGSATMRRTDGGVKQSSGRAWSRPTALLISVLSFCLGSVVDIRRRRGRVVRTDGERDD
jgi:glycosyltransferase involved in cell wall biosynthesis